MDEGIIRLNKMFEGQQDIALTKVVNHLKELKDIDTTIFLNDEKNLKGMCDYVKSRAKEFAVNNVAMIIDETVYEWSLNYWQLSNEELGIKKEEPKPIIPKPSNVVTKQVEETPPRAQLTLF